MYVDSLDLPDARYVTFVRSTVPHAVIRSIDTEAAKNAPGVEAIFTAAEVDIGPFPPNPFFPQLDQRFVRWPLANDRVRFVGEPIVAIVATTAISGADAAELVVIDYEHAGRRRHGGLAAGGVAVPETARHRCPTRLPPVDGLFDTADVVSSNVGQ